MKMNSHILAISSAMFLIVTAANSQAEGSAKWQRTLHGEYGLVTTQSCVRTPFHDPSTPGIDPATGQLLLDSEAVATVGTGTISFERDGSLMLSDGVMTELSHTVVSAGATPIPAPSKVNCPGHYSVNSNNEITMSMSCDVAPPQAGVSVVLEPLNFQGHVSRSREHIQLADVPGDLQKVSVLIGNTVVQQRERVCVMTGALTRLPRLKSNGAEASTEH